MPRAFDLWTGVRLSTPPPRRRGLPIVRDDFFRKSHRTSISWLILFKSNPLRWASVWFRCWSEADDIHSVAMLQKRRGNGRGNCHHGKQRSGRFLPFAAIGAGVTRFSLPCCHLSPFPGSKFWLYPFGSLRQASVPWIVHAGFPFGLRKKRA